MSEIDRPERETHDLLLSTLLSAVGETGDFDSKKFFDLWFKKRGSAHFFLFRKNLRVTNLQLVELLALIRCHSQSPVVENPERALHFVSVAEFNDSIRRLVYAFKSDGSDVRKCCHSVADLFVGLVNRLVVVDCFFGSCAVFMPPKLKLDLLKVCGYSGYIHSCGRNVFVRNFRKATRDDFVRQLRIHVDTRKREGKKVQLIFYGHEDFSKKDRRHASVLRDGLDDVKLYIDKYYFGSERFVDALRVITKEFKDHIEIPGPNEYSPDDEWKPRDPAQITLWVIADHGVGSVRRQRGEEQYFICYEQTYLNRNPLHLFEENKPAWVDHTTLPHTLAGAMLNVTRPWWPTGRVVVGDPFAGTGTTLFEAAKFGAVAICADRLKLARLVMEDNIDFFNLDVSELREFVETLTDLRQTVTHLSLQITGRGTTEPRAKKVGEDFEWAKKIVSSLLRDPASSDLEVSDDVLADIKGAGLAKRLLLYVALRADRRHYAAIGRGSEAWSDAFFAEAKELNEQIRDLLSIRLREPISTVDRVHLFSGSYSDRCVIDTTLLSDSSGTRQEIHISVASAEDFCPPEKCDVIMTDPPYGFNTEEDRRSLAGLYAAVLPLMIDALKPEGQLIFAVPDWSHTGRELPYFVLKEIVIREVLMAAERLGREVVTPAHSCPPRAELFHPPYYWESEKALRRAILHFYIRDRRQEKVTNGT